MDARKKQRRKIIHLEIGDPDFPTPSHIIQAVIKSLKEGETHYGEAQGLSDLRKAICKNVKKELGFLPDENQVVVGPSPALIYFLLQSIAKPGDEILIGEPGYNRIYVIFNLLNLRPVALPLKEEEGFKMNPQRLEKQITDKTKMIFINSPHNPTGSLMTRKQIAAIAKMVQKKKIFILSDEVYSKILYQGKHYSAGALDHCKKFTVILNSLSKAYAMTGWRVGYLIGPEEIIKKISFLIRNTIFSMPIFIQRAAIAALEGDQHAVKKMVREYKKRRDVLVKGLNEFKGISCQLPQGALYAFANIQGTGLTSREFTNLILKRAGVAFSPGTDFGKLGEGYVRAAFTSSLKEIQEALKRMAKILKKK